MMRGFDRRSALPAAARECRWRSSAAPPKHASHVSHLIHRSGVFLANGGTGERQEGLFQRLGAGLLLQLLRRSLRDDFAVIDDGDAMRHAVGFLHVVSGQEHGDMLLFVQLLDVRPELVAGLRIEAERGLVEEDDFRRVQQAAGDFQAPLHAAGELFHRIVAAIPQARTA